MADHGDNYKRMTGPEGEEVGSLTPHCGHHCGVITTGGTNKHTGHCSCVECHDNVKIGGVQLPVIAGVDFPEVESNFTSEQGGINPRGIV